MGQLEDLQMNRIIRAQQIQKGFCDNDTEVDIFKAHNVGDVHPNHPDWVWTQLPNGKYDWRVRKGQAKPTPAPAPKPSGEPDFTPKIPKEIASLTNRSDWQAFEAAYKQYGKDLFAEKYPDEQSWKDAVAANKTLHKDKDKEAYYLAMKALGLMGRSSQPQSKTAQIEQMKQLYVSQAKARQEAYQKAKNETHSAGEGAKRKDEILKHRDVLEDKIARSIEAAKRDIESLVATSVSDGHSNTKTIPVDVLFAVNYDSEIITIREMTNANNRFNSGIDITITHGNFGSKPGDEDYDEVGTAEINMSSMRTQQSDSSGWEHERNKMMLASTTMGQIDKIKKEIAGYARSIREARKEIEKLDKEMTQNH